MDLDKAALRRELRRAEPWLGALDVGPQAVDAGTCERCDRWPRLLPTCGPAGVAAVCRDCAQHLGDEGWCDGHRGEGRHARTWAAQLPDRWATAVVLWWVATGEVRLDALADVDPRQLDDRVRALLPAV